MAAPTVFGKRVGGAPSLDFVNTVRGRVGSRGSGGVRDFADQVVGERLVTYDVLLDWSAFAGVLTTRQVTRLARQAAERPGVAAATLRRAVALREALYRIFKAAIEGWPPRPEDLDTLNGEWQVARARERLVASPSFAVAWNETPLALDRVLWPIVRSAVELLTSPNVKRVGQCPGEACGWLFLDTSRSRRRQWCDMGECGNLAKVRRFRRKQRSPRDLVAGNGQGPRAKDQGPRAKDQGPRAKGQGPSAKGQGPSAKGQGATEVSGRRS